MQQQYDMLVGNSLDAQCTLGYTQPQHLAKIAIISDAEPVRNGVGAYYTDLAEHLRARGFDVRTFCPVHENGNSAAAFAFPMPGDTSQRLSLPNPFGLNAQLVAFAPDIAIVPTPGVYGLTGAFLCERMGLPVLVGFHTAFEQLAKLYWQKTVMAKMVRQYFRNSHSYLFNRCTNVVANTEDMCRLARRLGASSATTIGTLLPADFIQMPAKGHSGEVRRVLFAGRLAAEKNIQAVLQSARELPHMEFSVAGNGPLQSAVTEAENNLTNLNYLGWLSRDALRNAIDCHDMLVLPSHFESFGNIALEAMARQRPAIVTTRCGISKWHELRSGLTVINDGTDLTNALRGLAAQSPDTIRKMATASRDVAISLNNRSLDHWCEMLTLGETNQKGMLIQ